MLGMPALSGVALTSVERTNPSPVQPLTDTGRFYSLRDSLKFIGLRHLIAGHLQSDSFDELTVDTWQQWHSQNWQLSKGTAETAVVLESISDEEAESFTVGSPEITKTLNFDQLVQRHRYGLARRLRIITGAAINGNVEIDETLQSFMWGDGMDSKRVEEITIGHIDEMVTHGTVTEEKLEKKKWQLIADLAEHHAERGAIGDIVRESFESSVPNMHLLSNLARVDYFNTEFSDPNRQLPIKGASETVKKLIAINLLDTALQAHESGTTLAEIAKINPAERFSATPPVREIHSEPQESRVLVVVH